MKRTYLDLVMLEPDWLLQMRPFEFDVIETERFVDIWMGDDVDCSDCTFQSSKGAIAYNTHATTCRKYLIAHQMGIAPVPSPLRVSRDYLTVIIQEAYLLGSKKATKERFFSSSKDVGSAATRRAAHIL